MENNIDTIETMSQAPEDTQTENSTGEFTKVTTKMILDQFGPKRAFKKGYLLSTSGGWREGYTKPLVADRTAARRKTEKNRRKVKQAQRKLGQRCTN